MFNRNQLIAILVILIVLASLFFLVRVTFSESQQLMSSSRPRLNAFVIVHLVIIGMMVWFSQLGETYSYVRWGFFFSLTVTLIISAVEVTILARRLNNKGYDIRAVEPVELAFLNCYFILYMYALIASFLSGLFFCFTECCIKIREYKIRKAVRQSVFPVKFSSSLIEIECSICLSHLEEDEELLQIKCKHVFHRNCLLEWIKQKQTCPTCRFSIFQALNSNGNHMAVFA